MILLIEDDDIIRETIAEFLAEHYEVIVAANGREAVALCEQYGDKIKGVITDYEMPEMNGIEFLRWLQQRKCSAPKLLMTGKALSDAEREEIVLLCGAEPLSKPVDFDVLAQMIAQHFFGANGAIL